MNTASAPPSRRTHCAATPPASAVGGSLARAVFDACRPKQWVKNVLVLAAPFAAGRLTDPRAVGGALLAGVAFVLASSATYLINDAGDVKADRLHPTKSLRPIAAGRLRVGQARAAASMLVGLALTLAWLSGPTMIVVLAAYLVTTTGYTRWLKRVPVVDVLVVASGFVLRTAAGAAGAHVPLTPVFLAIAAGGALFIVLGKRMGELAELGADAASHRLVLGWYTPVRCTLLLGGALAVTVGAFTVWALGTGDGASTSSLATGTVTPAAVAIVPFVAASARAWLLVRAGRGADPLRLFASNRTLQLLGLAMAVLVALSVYA
ncbi:decaprenyl-phosphate phosphoribosyltransferase [Aquihabitans sp. G128]|uniref:decaprenyl-phosphate phosphoribosyltransferase n=1 Tax=Aquihabitans sp. G128 TaxID=2849779 RepID=UPI001C2495CC|nr:decaprenyl-phosphate phosphoribosyltransferase [Aquihabitans sp. G128]QXC61605.1 decaprenyl-phosphate phosphoribosyltransferase [Aquihabitans sp. G128]